MNFDNYEELEVYREVNGWQCALALDKQRQQSVAINRLLIDSTVSQDAVQHYLLCLRQLSENPHPNLIAVLEAGVQNDQLIVVTEWLEAEDLTARKDRGLSFDQIESMSAAIAHALRHLHSLGIVHRTINPESVLFEPETQTIRLDVPLWKLDTHEFSIRVDEVFDAPEVLSRQQFSAVSDVYSVGILVYSTLVGSFPWTDQNGTPQIRAAEDSVPRLPSSLSSIQQEIDEMLAFDPSARNYSYEGFFDLSADEQTDSIIARGTQYRSGMIDIAEVQQVALPLDQSVANTSVSPSAKSRFWIYGTLLTIALVGVLASLYAYTNFDSVRMLLYEIGLADHPDLSERWRQAESLRLDQNQSLITLIAAYNKVLELKPSHIGAQQAIADGKKERRETIETLIKTDEFAVAQARLDEYVTAVPNDVEIAALVTQLENRQRRDRLLADARPLVAAGMDDLALLHAAVLAYKSVLSVFPDSEEARRRLHDIAVRYAEEAINAAAAAEIDNAWDFYEKAKDADPGRAGVRTSS